MNPSFLLCGLLLVTAGCFRSGEPADLVIINGAEPETLDPGILTGQADGRIAQAIFEGLTRYNPKDATAIPGLAERWDISEDLKTYTFHLRPNAVWSTGEPITADDFFYSWMRVLDPTTGADYVGLLYYIKGAEDFSMGKTKDPSTVGIRVLDRHTFQVELTAPTPFFLDLCAMQTLAVVPQWVVEKHGDRWLKVRPLPVSGSYELESWRLNDRVRLRKNHRYWDATNTASEIIDLLPCTSASTALNLFQTGAADIVWDKDLVPTDLLDVLMKRPDFHKFDTLGCYFVRFNVTRKPFDDPRVRKALVLSIDRKRIVEKITRGGERPASHFVPPGIANYEPVQGLEYNPDLARKLLEEAGYPQGKGFPRFQYMYNSQKTHENIAVQLQEMWRRELGIEMELRQLEWKVYLNAQSAREYDLSRSSWVGDYNDPNTFLDLFMSNNGNNRTGWKNPEYDQLLMTANAQTNVQKRAELLQRAEALLVREEAPIAPLYIYVGLEYYDDRKIEGVYSNIRAEHPLRVIRKKKDTVLSSNR